MRKLVLGVMMLAGLAACGSEEKTAEQAPPMTGGTPLNLNAITMMVPDGWQAQEPSSRMRQAQYLLPGNNGDDAELVVLDCGDFVA